MDLTMYAVFVEFEDKPRAMFGFKDDAVEWADKTFLTVRTQVREVQVQLPNQGIWVHSWDARFPEVE